MHGIRLIRALTMGRLHSKHNAEANRQLHAAIDAAGGQRDRLRFRLCEVFGDGCACCEGEPVRCNVYMHTGPWTRVRLG